MIRTFFHSLLASAATTTLLAAAPLSEIAPPVADDQSAAAESPQDTITPPSETADINPKAPPRLSEEQLKERVAALAARQDELSAIIQDLSWKWADKDIAKFLEDVDYALLDARDALDNQELGGETIAAQNDAIEKIYQAAKKNQQSSSSQSDSLGAMMDQLDYMTGKKSMKPGKGQPGKEGDQPGEGGGTGAQDDGIAKAGNAEKALLENRTIPKATGRAPSSIPSEFREGMEALRESLANASQ